LLTAKDFLNHSIQEIAMYLSQNIRLLMEKNRLKRKDLSEALKISYNQTGKYLSGENQPKIDGLIILGKLFNVAIDDLILVDLSQEEGRKFVEAPAGQDVDEQTRELNKLLRLRLARVEAAVKALDPERAKELGIE
jgi:transcriptional regulator with XRE-family HTH domain